MTWRGLVWYGYVFYAVAFLAMGACLFAMGQAVVEMVREYMKKR